MNGRIKMKIVDSSYKGEPVDACELCSDFELGYGVIHVGTVCPINEARTIARKLYAENKRLKADNDRMSQFMEVYNNKIAPWINNAAEILYFLGRSIDD